LPGPRQRPAPAADLTRQRAALEELEVVGVAPDDVHRVAAESDDAVAVREPNPIDQRAAGSNEVVPTSVAAKGRRRRTGTLRAMIVSPPDENRVP
jgi:hypothetical protein